MWQPQVHRYIIASVFMIAGVLHVVKPSFFVKIMPNYIPAHFAMVYLSGVAEIAGGLGILFMDTQLWAGWGLIVLLVAVFPANINMTVQAVQKAGYNSWYAMATMARLPLQFLLIYWVYWACLGKV